MKKNILKNLNKTVIFTSASMVVLLLFALFFLWTGIKNSYQSSQASIAGTSFQGEYKIGDGEWHPIVEGEHISSTQGDVTLRGIFKMHNPVTGEIFKTLTAEKTVSLYFNHIGGYAILPEGGKIVFDAENDLLGEDACAVMWGSVPSPGDTPITLVLHNPHSFGNENAIDDFLKNMSAAPGIYFESMMLKKGELQRNIGLFILITSLIILGIAIFSTFIYVKKYKEMWLIGLMSLFAGGYLLFDAFAVSIWNQSYVANTRMLGLCMMFYMLFGTMLIVTILQKRIRQVAFFATLASGIVILCCIALSFLDRIKFFDTWLVWAITEIIVEMILILCLLLGMRGSSSAQKRLYVASIIFLSSFPIDFLATILGWWEGGMVAKFVFFAIFIMALIVVLLVIPSHINAATRAQELEREQQLLKQELREKRISIMLSQLKPHFIFNTLNTIYHLCDIDPDKAKNTISAFSTYLRNNINNLDQSEMIAFEKELSFINAYLDIEKVRFDDELLIFFDIAVSNFKLPVLTVQPIVENAVKHGTSKKEGVSHLYISTRETDAFYEIKIRDTGIGFETDHKQDNGRNHIGIRNVRQRLETLCNGSLTIESTPGLGTTALIKIPKTEASLK